VAEPVFMKLGKYIMAHEPISTTYFINSSYQSDSLYVYSPIIDRQWLCKNRLIIARQQLGKNIIAAMNTPTRKEELLDTSIVFYSVCMLSIKVSD
jgi:hypothetical protein